MNIHSKPSRKSSRPLYSGFTLIESLICLALILISFSIISPLLKNNDQQIRLNVCQNQLIQALHFARNQAFLSGKPMILQADPASDDWTRGMVLLTDTPDHRYETSLLQHQWSWNCRNVLIKWQGFLSDKFLVFAANPTQAASSGRFRLFAGDSYSDVIINRLGRIRSLSRP
ncbi:Tfp type 4 fimbrial pilin related signal peptide protein domain protein [Legionella quinlivanii]|uniref:Type II secretion system protein H n=1 Tax=Legionella quinlivanii TaxID=45073 RepID=A0A0W0XTZ5_9GAMM|nr:GspH/FimT family pseudopilin [Legionella quinlivanii]KTD48041.1 Tfp type 4 fimbrial pilin related signal peptide protein domain protein [Legionella quinlivanii]MCW8450677.1 GspH/FimT family pseudopilin [Legionella quinlivanii]SEG21920.1 Type II transport protein GspH [Legionella quinlivanii DSM 21216]STY11154.1 Tfp type 4 fimbrial pilin related signal peptide protein domain [Legionella quinlivanii]